MSVYPISDKKPLNLNISREALHKYVTESLVKTHTLNDTKNIVRYLDKKLVQIMSDMLAVATSTLPHSYFSDDDSVKVLQSLELRDKWGQITFTTQRKYANSLLIPILCNVKREGTTGVATAVSIKEITMDALMEFAIEDNTDAVWKKTFNFEGLDVFETQVDSDSLRSFLEQEEILIRKLSGNKRDKALRNISMSKAILTSLNDTGVLVQEAEIAASGRCYLKGLNLQSAPKAVRHAALGGCHLYDMRVAAFGVTGALAKAFVKQALGVDKDYHYIKTYIKHKDATRIKIVRAVFPEETKDFTSDEQFKLFDGFYKVKAALTAIGFGAKQSATAIWKDQNNNWQRTSLLQAFRGSVEQTKRFLDCSYAKALIDEYVECSDVIDWALKNDLQFAAMFELNNEMSRGQRLALVYQSVESWVIKAFIDASDATPLLIVHDGVYVKNKLNVVNVWSKLKIPLISDMSYIQFEHIDYAYNARSAASVSVAVDELNHKQFIAEQERIAQDYVPVHTTVSVKVAKPDYTNETKQEYESRRRIQFELDIAEGEQLWKEQNGNE